MSPSRAGVLASRDVTRHTTTSSPASAITTQNTITSDRSSHSLDALFCFMNLGEEERRQNPSPEGDRRSPAVRSLTD